MAVTSSVFFYYSFAVCILLKMQAERVSIVTLIDGMGIIM